MTLFVLDSLPQRRTRMLGLSLIYCDIELEAHMEAVCGEDGQRQIANLRATQNNMGRLEIVLICGASLFL